MARKQMVSPPEEGTEVPEFILPAAQGGQFRLGLRTARGPVAVVFYRGAWSEECVEYFKALAEKEREINVAGATLAGVGVVEPDEAREFARTTGFKSYVLYDYLREMVRDYGLLERDAEHGEIARPAAFLVGSDYTVLRAWPNGRPAPEDLLAEVSRTTGLPKEPEEGEEAEEKSKRRPRKSAETAGDEFSEGGTESGSEAAAGERRGRAGKSAPAAAKGQKKAESGTEAGESGGSAGAASESPEPREAGGADEAAAEPGESPESTEPESGGAGESPGGGER